jgi:hypothetical protein
MASTGTSKQPMLVDRPLFGFAVLGPVAALNAVNNLASLAPSGLVTLVPATDDGAMVDSISVVANESATTAARVIIFASTQTNTAAVSPSNTVPVASAVINSDVVGRVTNIPLLPILAPVHNVSRAGTGLIEELEKKSTGLMVKRQITLFAGLSERILAPTPVTTITVLAQGGYY